MATYKAKHDLLERFGFQMITLEKWSNGVYKLDLNIVYKITIERLENLLTGLTEGE